LLNLPANDSRWRRLTLHVPARPGGRRGGPRQPAV